MERRVYFIFGDVLACAAAGALAAWLAWYAVPVDWNDPLWMALGMIVGMGLGMPAGMVTGILFAPVFGGMEIMVPAALSGMVAGMAAGMLHPMAGAGPAAALGGGAVVGLACLAWTYVLQARLAGDAT